MYVHEWLYRGGITKCTYMAGIIEGAYTNVRTWLALWKGHIQMYVHRWHYIGAYKNVRTWLAL